jgi:CBS domain-containing protein
MLRADHYEKEVATIDADASCQQMAEAMRDEAVGSLVVMQLGVPVGIVTDRDLLRRVIADQRDTGSLVASDIMSRPLVSVTPETPLDDVVSAMAARSIRRIPVVRGKELVGMVSLDDLLASLTGELKDVSDAARRSFMGAQRGAQVRKLVGELEDKVREWGEELERVGGDVATRLGDELKSLRERIQGRN